MSAAVANLAQAALARLTGGDPDGALALLAVPRAAEEYAVCGMACLAGAQWDGARAALTRAMALGDLSAPTLLNLALAEDRLGLDGRGRLRTAAGLWPHWDEPPLRLAESCRRAGERAAAVAAYERALELNPDRIEALLGLGAMLITEAEPARARLLLLRCCALAPDSAEAWDALGIATRACGDAAAAEAAFAAAQRLRPGDIGLALRRAGAALAAGTGAAELARLEAAARHAPRDIALATARGVLLCWLGRAEEAATLLQSAAAQAPDEPLTAAALAESLVKTTRLAAAVPALRRAVALCPDDWTLRNNLAAALTRTHGYREARELLEALIASQGERTELLCNLANALVLLGRQREGVEVARRAAALAPETHLCWRTLGASLIYAEEATGAELRQVAERASATLGRDGIAPSRPSDPGRRLRLGLLSAKLTVHPVAWLTVAGFEALDQREFEIVCLGPRYDGDMMQRRYRALGAWHAVTGQPNEQIAARIRALEIDILIDLGGWGDHGLLSVCGNRPAPVQLKWVGNQAYTTGMPEIDWYVGDRWELPVGAERFYTERLLRLPDGYVCYSPPGYAPEVAPLPAAESGRITFGAFHNFAKVTPAVIAAWAQVVRRVAGSRLVVKAHQFADPETVAYAARAFAAHGVDGERLVLSGPSAHDKHLGQHAEIDIMLDAFPYTGGLTTCESLWMGVPVLTLAGEAFAARHSASHMNNLGLIDWVATGLDEYAELAVVRAADLGALARLRAELRDRMRASPLCDAPRFGRNFGAALRAIWQEACARA